MPNMFRRKGKRPESSLFSPYLLSAFSSRVVRKYFNYFPHSFSLPSPFSFLFSSLPVYSTKHNLTRCLVVAMERKKKGKDEGKRKREEKEKKIIPFDVFGYRKERKEKKMWVLSFPCLFAKRKEKKNACFYLCALINDKKIHILEE